MNRNLTPLAKITSMLLFLLALGVTTSDVHAAEITSLSDASIARSGRLLIFGSAFGTDASSSQVLIDGTEAIVTEWTNSEIHAYVPEASALGSVDVQVVTPSGPSNVLTLDVTLRPSDGRLNWRFQLDENTVYQHITVAPDGTIYVSDSQRLYALSSDGALLWVVAGAGGARPISLDANGTIYTGGDLVKAISPAGAVLWQVSNPSPFYGLLCGPNVGPDGNIYAVQDSDLSGAGYGVFCLSPSGDLLFSNVQFWTTYLNNSSIVFGSDRFFTGISYTVATPTLDAYDMADGEIIWDQTSQGISGGGLPVVDPLGRVVFRWGQIGMQAISADGDVEWISTHPGSAGYILQRPAVASDGTIYSGATSGIRLWAIEPDGSTRWYQPHQSGKFLHVLEASPDASTVVGAGTAVTGGGAYFNSWVGGYLPADGALLWEIVFPPESGVVTAAPSSRVPAFSPDSQTVYVSMQLASSLIDYGYLYSIDASSGLTPADAMFIRGDSSGDGTVDVGDPIFSLAHLFQGEASFCLSAHDTNDDGGVDISDVVWSLSYLFSAGPEPLAPFASCDVDPTADGLGCLQYTCP